MPSLTRKPKPDPTAIYVATDTFAGDLPGAPNTLVRRGDRLRGGHPAVVHMFANGSPDFFVPDGSSDEDMAKARARLAPEYVGPVGYDGIHLPQPIPPERQLRATTTIYNEHMIAVWDGEIVDRDDPRVREWPDKFEPVRSPDAA